MAVIAAFSRTSHRNRVKHGTFSQNAVNQVTLPKSPQNLSFVLF